MARYGNIEGIATLTDNANARDNARGTIGRIMADRKKQQQKPARQTKATDKK